jgi:hypothetical protein
MSFGLIEWMDGIREIVYAAGSIVAGSIPWLLYGQTHGTQLNCRVFVHTLVCGIQAGSTIDSIHRSIKKPHKINLATLGGETMPLSLALNQNDDHGPLSLMETMTRCHTACPLVCFCCPLLFDLVNCCVLFVACCWMLIVNMQWLRLLLLLLVVLDHSFWFFHCFGWLLVWCCFCSSSLAVTVDAFVAPGAVDLAVVAVRPWRHCYFHMYCFSVFERSGWYCLYAALSVALN